MDREPALIIGAVVGALEALIALAVTLGWVNADAAPQLVATVIAVGAAIGAVLQAWLTRSRVYAPATVDAIRAEGSGGGD